MTTTEPIPTDLDGTPLDQPAIRHAGWSRNLINRQLRNTWRRANPKPIHIPAPRDPAPEETALYAAFKQQGMTLPGIFAHDAIAVAYHLFGVRLDGYPYTSEPTLPEPTPFRPSIATGWDSRRWHIATQRAITVIDPNQLKYDDRGAAAIRILETLRETLGIHISGWSDIEAQP